MSLRLTISTAGSPALEAAHRLLTDKALLHDRIAGAVGSAVQDYIRVRSQTPAYHRTATRLGATPTNYYERAASGVQTIGTTAEAEVRLTQSTEIFQRVLGDVKIVPKARKWLALPAAAAAYGKRPREHSGLRYLPLGPSRAALVKGPAYQRQSSGKRRTAEQAADYRAQLKAQTKIMYWLRRSVTLPQDRALLPSDAQITDAAEMGARDAIQHTLDQS
jgi:hypothetical protein